MPTLPKMVPHTAAKHLLLKKYLDRWFPILGKYHPRINYIDGFAGPGEYLGGERGSPILAIEAAKYHVENGTLPPNVEINFVFVEANPAYAAHLRGQLAGVPHPKQFSIEVIDGEFADVIGGFLDELRRNNQHLAPTFAFVDPFGFSGVPFDLMARILSYPRCEVYINIMIEFINRFIEHPNEQVVAHFPKTFGTDEVLDVARRPGDRIEALLSLYRRQLKSKAQFVGRFDMHGKSNQQTYSLFFASNSEKGFEKMKEANWSVDKGEGGRFSDFEPGVADQTTFSAHFALWDDLLARFRGKRVPMEDIDRFVIRETDFLTKHARAIFKVKEASGLIGVEVAPGQKRRKGDYPAGKVSIVFPS